MRYADIRRSLLSYGPLLVALAIEVAVFEHLGRVRGNPSFISSDTLILVLNQSAEMGIMAVGMTFVIITGGIDLSIGSLVGLSGVTCALLVRWAETSGHPVWAGLLLGWLAALGLGLAAGGLSGTLINLFRIPPFIATLALMSSLRGTANLLTGGKPVSPLPDEYIWLGRYYIGGVIPVSVVLFTLVMVGGWVLLNHTRMGRNTLALGGNEESARLSGVPIANTKWMVYTLCSVLACTAGLITSSRLGSGDPKVGLGEELNVIAAVVVGGTSLSGGRGTITGTLVGLLVVSVLYRGLNWIGVETFGQQVTLGLVILAAVLLDQVKSWRS